LAGKARSLDHDIDALYLSARLPNGTVIRGLPSGVGPTAQGLHFSGSSDSDAEIRKSVERVASAFGLTVDRVTVFHALGAAPAVVLTAPHVAALAAHFTPLEHALFGSVTRGYFIEIRGENGKPYIWRSVSSLTGQGGCGSIPLSGSHQPF